MENCSYPGSPGNPEFLDLLARKRPRLERNSRIGRITGTIFDRDEVAKFPGNGNNRVDISSLSAGFTRKSREIDSVPSECKLFYLLSTDRSRFLDEARLIFLRYFDNRK